MSKISTLITQIMDAGLSQCAIERATKIPQPRVWRWLHQGSKSADDALKLAELAKKVKRKAQKGQGDAP